MCKLNHALPSEDRGGSDFHDSSCRILCARHILHYCRSWSGLLAAQGAISVCPTRGGGAGSAQVRFTCNLCGNTYVKPVNPHAWKNGSVFARCDECDVVHKLVDGLKLFHEYHSWKAPNLSNIRIPKGLPQRPSIDYHTHPALYVAPDDD